MDGWSFSLLPWKRSMSQVQSPIVFSLSLKSLNRLELMTQKSARTQVQMVDICMQQKTLLPLGGQSTGSVAHS